MYYKLNTYIPKKDTQIMLFVTLFGLLIAGYAMIALLVINYNAIIAMQNYCK